MAYGGSPHTDSADAVRVLVGDTGATALLDSNTYTFILAQEPNVYARAALAAEMLAGKYALEMDRRVGDLWRSAKVRFDHFLELAKKYRLEAARRGRPYPFAGGTSIDDVQARNDDEDRVKPRFQIGMQDAIGTHVTDPDTICTCESCS